ncbi:MAG TPA: hypothetical protein DEP99_00510 [Nitrospiraceae bacterium]|nr:hypothetical protein [Nitrospiraceae bacterium]
MGKKILIVEDDEKNLKLMRVILKNAGYETIEAENGEKGVKLAKENIPSLILMDIQMPVMDGIEALRILKTDPLTKDIPVIAFTSYTMKGNKERFLEEGFDGYLSKPIDVKGFLDIVKSILGE